MGDHIVSCNYLSLNTIWFHQNQQPHEIRKNSSRSFLLPLSLFCLAISTKSWLGLVLFNARKCLIQLSFRVGQWYKVYTVFSSALEQNWQLSSSKAFLFFRLDIVGNPFIQALQAKTFTLLGICIFHISFHMCFANHH